MDVILFSIDPASQFPLEMPPWLRDNHLLFLFLINHGQIISLQQGSLELYRMLDDPLTVVVVVLKLVLIRGPLC